MDTRYYIDADLEELSIQDIDAYVQDFKMLHLPKLQRLNDYYNGKNEAITKRFFEDLSKPNHKTTHAFGRYITTTNVSIFMANPITYTSDSNIEDFKDLLKNANEEDVNVDIATHASIYGYGVQLAFLNEEAIMQLVALDPRSTILIYDNSVQPKLKYAIRFWETNSITNYQTSTFIEVYSATDKKLYKDGALIDTNTHNFSDIPVIVYPNNTEHSGDFEHVTSIIDAYDLLQSDAQNENEYFNNAYLYLNVDADSVTQEDILKMKERRVLLGKDLAPQFILKQSNFMNTELEDLKNRYVGDIHKLSMTPDLSDNNFSNNVSGVAMKYKLLGTLNNIETKKRRFKTGLQYRNKLILEMLHKKALKVPVFIDMTFNINLPTDIAAMADMINKYRGLVSNKTLLEQIHFIQDVEWEMEQVAKEQGTDTYGRDVTFFKDLDEGEPVDAEETKENE